MNLAPFFRPRFRRSAPAKILAVAAALLCCATMPACEEFGDEGDVSDDALNGRATADASSGNDRAAGAGTAGSTAAEEQSQSQSSGGYNTSGEIGAISWKGKNVSGWPVTTTLRASVKGGTIHLDYDKSKSWPVVDGVCANAWAIVNIGGKWHAGTFEYLRPGQTTKSASALDGSGGDHFKVSPLSSWRPQKGEVFGLMVSGLCRGGRSNVEERSNICVVRWP